MDRVLVLYEDYDTRFINVGQTKEKLYSVALKILKERIETEYIEKDLEKACSIVALGSGKMAWDFLVYRSDEDYEYERVDVIYPEELGD